MGNVLERYRSGDCQKNAGHFSDAVHGGQHVTFIKNQKMDTRKDTTRKRFEKMKVNLPRLGVLTVCLLAFGCGAPEKEYPAGVTFKHETLVRKGNFGDNWCQTWAADDNIYTMLDDGNGWWGNPVHSQEFAANGWENSMLIRIKGGPDFTDEDVMKMPGWPFNPITGSFYAYGTVSVDSVIYVWLWKSEVDKWYSRAIGNRLLYSPDYGQTFYRWDGQKETEETFSQTDSASFFFYKEDPKWHMDRDAYAFNWIAMGQNGKDNSKAKDEYVYMYAPEQYEPRDLAVIKVHRDSILHRSAYQYFQNWNGEDPEWTRDMTRRGVNLRYPDDPKGREWMWASWFPDVVYNEGLDLHIMVSYGVTDEGRNYWDNWCGFCKYPASVGFWYAENPWGPWTQFHYEEDFHVDREENRTYGFKLSPKWISDDGKTMHLIWSDAGDDHSTYYKWNQMEITIEVK